MDVAHLDVARSDSVSSLASVERPENKEDVDWGGKPRGADGSSHSGGQKAPIELQTAHERQQLMRKGRTVKRWMEYTHMESLPSQALHKSGQMTLLPVPFDECNETSLGTREVARKPLEDEEDARRRRGEQNRRKVAQRSGAKQQQNEKQTQHEQQREHWHHQQQQLK